MLLGYTGAFGFAPDIGGLGGFVIYILESFGPGEGEKLLLLLTLGPTIVKMFHVLFGMVVKGSCIRMFCGRGLAGLHTPKNIVVLPKWGMFRGEVQDCLVLLSIAGPLAGFFFFSLTRTRLHDV